MDNPVYFYPFACSPNSKITPFSSREDITTLEDTFNVNDSDAKELLNTSLTYLESKVCKTQALSKSSSCPQDAPSVKLRKKCSIRRLLSGGSGKSKEKSSPKSPALVKRSRSLNQDVSPARQDFAVERSQSFSISRTNSKMSMTHDESQAESVRKRNSAGAVCVQRQHSIHHHASAVPGIEANGNSFGVAQFQRDFRNLDFGGNSFNMASASTLPITRQRPPLPPNRTACSLMKPEDFATTFRSNRFSAGSGSGPGSPNRAGPIIGPVGPKPHVMHRQCNNNNKKCCDVAIVFSAQCHVSKEWAQYVSNLIQNQGFCDIILQDVETLSLLATKINDQDSQENLKAKEELVFHAKAQIIILSQTLLDWIYSHPGLIIGNLFKDESKVIGLMLGITKDHVKAEHRSELLTFGVWKYFYQIKPKEHDVLSTNIITAVSSMISTKTSAIIAQPLNTNTIYTNPKSIVLTKRNYQTWPKVITEENPKVLLVITGDEKICQNDKMKITAEVFIDEQMSMKKEIKSFNLIQVPKSNNIVEVTFPDVVLNTGVFMKIKFEINGNTLDPLNNSNENGVIQIKKKSSLQELDQYLSSYLEQMNSGSIIENRSKKCPTLLHYAAKHGMKKLAGTILSLPGGLQMASMNSKDGLNARDLAIHAGHLELAKLFKANSDQPRDYEFPVLKPLSGFTPPTSPISKSSTNHYYDIPRTSEQFYCIPPPPIPVIEALNTERCAISGTITNTEVETRVPKKSEAKKDMSYLPMLPKKPSKQLVPEPENCKSGEDSLDKRPTRSQSLTMAKTDTEMIEYAISSSNSSRHLHSPPPPSSSSERRPQSRQELLNSVKKTISLEDLHEPQPFYENLTEKEEEEEVGRRRGSNSSSGPNLKLLGVTKKSSLLIDNDNNNEPKSPLSIVTPFPMITLESKPSASLVTKTIIEDDLHDTKSLYRSTQEELINIQNMFKKGKLNIQEVEDKFELWKTRPEVIKANTNHKTEVDEMKLEWEKLRKDVMNKKNDEGLLKRIKNSRGKKKSLSDLTKFSTLPSMPFRARKPSTNSRSSSSNLLKDERVKSMSESSTCSTLDSDSSSSPILNVCSDSSWSAETTASNVDGYLAAAAASEASEAENKSKKVAYDNVVIEDGNVRLSD